MQKGEKVALWLAFGAIGLVIAMAVIMEIHTQKNDVLEKTTQGETTESARMGVWMIPKGVNPAALPEPHSPGAKALQLYCAQCHELPVPAMHTPMEWSAVLMRMRGAVKDRGGRGMLSRMTVPGEKDWDTLFQYLRKHALQPIDAEQYQLDSPGAGAFMSTCSQCHGAPSPKLHTAKQWPRVVLRMKQHMQSGKAEIPDPATTQQIVDFLKANSGSDS